MIARTLIPGGRVLAWLMATVFAVLLAGCKTDESSAPPTGDTNLTVPAQEVSILSLPADLVPAGARVDWSLNYGPATSGPISLVYPWTASQVQFWPPVDGVYEFTATVRHAGHVLRKRIQVTVTPQATISYNVPIGVATNLSMPPAEIPAGTTSITWTVAAHPEAASYTLDPLTNTVDFTPDTEGVYTFLVSMKVGDATRRRVVHVAATGYGRIQQVGFDPVDARFSQAGDVLLLLDKTSPVLHAYSLTTGTMTDITLPGVGNTLSLSEDGLIAVVGQATRVTRINVGTLSVVSSITTGRRYASLAVDNAGVVVGVPDGDGPVPLDTLDFGAGTVRRSDSLAAPVAPARNVVPAGSQATVAGGRFYVMMKSGEPADLLRLEFIGGVARVAYDSPYAGDYPMSGRLWALEDINETMTSAGSIFFARDAVDEDMGYWGDLEQDAKARQLAWVDYSYEADTALVIRADESEGSGNVGGPEVDFYRVLLKPESTVTMPLTVVGGRGYVSRAVWGFFSSSGGNHVIVTRARDTARLADSALVGGWSILVRD